MQIIASTVQFLGGRQEGEGAQPQFVPSGAPAENADFGSGGDDDIPF